MTQKTWFITGSSSGFGLDLTRLLLERGDRVVATARRPEVLADLAAAHGDRLMRAALDVTDTAAIRRVVAEAFDRFKQIDVVVSNAGYGLMGAAEEVSDEQLLHEIDTNLIGSIQLTRAVLPYLRAQGSGRILQLSSMGGQVGIPGYSLYHATKWGIEGFFEAVMLEVAPFGIECTLVEPGGAKTEFAGRTSVVVPQLDAYAGNPSANVRLPRVGARRQPGDPLKMVHAMIACADAPHMPKRLTLGSDAYRLVHAALSERLQALEAQRALAHSTDFDDYVYAPATAR